MKRIFDQNMRVIFLILFMFYFSRIYGEEVNTEKSEWFSSFFMGPTFQFSFGSLNLSWDFEEDQEGIEYASGGESVWSLQLASDIFKINIPIWKMENEDYSITEVPTFDFEWFVYKNILVDFLYQSEKNMSILDTNSDSLDEGLSSKNERKLLTTSLCVIFPNQENTINFSSKMNYDGPYIGGEFFWQELSAEKGFGISDKGNIIDENIEAYKLSQLNSLGVLFSLGYQSLWNFENNWKFLLSGGTSVGPTYHSFRYSDEWKKVWNLAYKIKFKGKLDYNLGNNYFYLSLSNSMFFLHVQKTTFFHMASIAELGYIYKFNIF